MAGSTGIGIFLIEILMLQVPTSQVDSEGDVVTARLLGKLDPSAYDGVNEEIDNVMSRAEHVRLVLDLREFDGWSGLSALGDHLSLVREHYRVPERLVNE